jgi:hypothetical protein
VLFVSGQSKPATKGRNLGLQNQQNQPFRPPGLKKLLKQNRPFRAPVSLQRMVRRLRHHFLWPLEPFQSATVTRKKVAGMDVASWRGLWFWRLNSSSSSFCKSAARPFFSAASKAFMVGP